MMLKLSIVIPTKDREEDIIKCVESISKQTSMPAEVLVIDDGQISETTKEKIRQMLLEKDIVFKYFKKDNPGLAESKNLGAKESNGDVVLFLDDDVILDKDYIKNLLIIWSKKWNEKKLAGVSGVISNSRIKSSAEILFNKIFFLYSAKPWSILPWGFQTWDFHLKKDEFSDWVPGGTSSFRKEIFNIYQFKALQPGRTASEDVEFCWQLKNDNYYFIITPSAKLLHKESPVGKEKDFILGFKEGENRKTIFMMHAQKSIKNYFGFYVSSLGWITRQFLGGHYKRGFGIISGYLKNDNPGSKYKRAIVASAVIFLILLAAFFFDKGLSIGLGLILILSLITFFILNKLGLKDKKILLLFLIVLAIHLCTTLFMHYAKFQPFSGGSGDYTLYQSQAQEIAVRIHQGNFSLQGISLSHYYPVVIGYIYALTLPEEIIGLMLNVWLVAISVVFVYLIILEIGGAPKNAFTIGLIAAIYPSYVFDSGLLLKDTLETFFIILGLLFLLKVIKKFTWYNFIVLYLAIIATTHFRFYVGYALIAAFILSWFLFSKIDFKKRIIYGIIFIILSGFIPQIVVGDGYYGINSLRSYLSSKTLNFYRQVAYNPVYNQKPVVSNPVVVSKPVASNPVVVSKPVVSIPISTVGMDSSFKVGNGPIGYTESFVYVLLGPFPWQIKNLRQSLALFETFPWYLLLFFIIDGIIVCFKKRIKVAAPLLIFSIVTMVVIAVFETNFGLIARVRIPAFTALLCFASFGLNKNNILYNYLQKNYEKIFSYGRSRFYRQPPG